MCTFQFVMVTVAILQKYMFICQSIGLVLGGKFAMVGYAIMFSMLGPWWPNAIDAFSEGKVWRAFSFFVGIGECVKIEGFLATPEVAFVRQLIMAVFPNYIEVVADCLGLNLNSGKPSNHMVDMSIALVVFIGGFLLAPLAMKLFDAHEKVDVVRIAEASVLDSVFDQLWAVGEQLWFYFIYGADMVAMCCLVGTSFTVWSGDRIGMWLLVEWVLCGLWPVFAAPPPMPILRPSVPHEGWRWMLHRFVSSGIFLLTLPPLTYCAALPVEERWIWPIASIMRQVHLISLAVVVSHRTYLVHEKHHAVTIHHQTKLEITFIYVCLMLSSIHTLSHALRLLWRQHKDLAKLHGELEDEEAPRMKAAKAVIDPRLMQKGAKLPYGSA